MAKYRIQWVSLITGNSGQGKPAFNTLEEAKKTAEFANKKWPMLKHWPAISFCPEYDDKHPKAFLV